MIPKRDIGPRTWFPDEIDEFLWTRQAGDGLERELDELRPWFWSESQEDLAPVAGRPGSA
jgi:hypothetical protein